MFKRKCKLVFVCHGATSYTEENRLYDKDEYPPLTESGRIQIFKIASWLKEKDSEFDKIYTSGALRTVQSARILAEKFKKDYEIVEKLHGRKVGLWGGMTFNQIGKKHPDLLEKYHQNPSSFYPEGGETAIELNKRVDKQIKKIIDKNIHKRILVVTHSGFIQSAIGLALGITPENISRIYVPTGSATQINYYEEWSSLVYSSILPE